MLKSKSLCNVTKLSNVMVQCESFVLFVIQYKKQYVMGTDIENADWCFYSNGTGRCFAYTSILSLNTCK